MRLDYSNAGFKAGFKHGARRALSSLIGNHHVGRPVWPAPPMPTVNAFLQVHGGTSMSRTEFDQAETEWYAMLDERNHVFNRYLQGMRAGNIATWVAAIILFIGFCLLVGRLI